MSGVNVRVDIRTSMPAIARAVEQMGRQGRFAMAVALTRTAQDVRKEERSTMQRVFDRPTPYTLNSLFVAGATKETLEARVWLKDDQAVSNGGTPATRYLLPQIDGGARGMKRLEKMLDRVGVMPRGWRAVPGQGASMDAYGNMSRSQVIQILSYFQAWSLSGQEANNSTAATRAKLAKGTRKRPGISYFVSRGRTDERTPHLAAGIWQRVGPWRLKPVLIFVPRVSYRKRFDFMGVADKAIRERFPTHFEAAAVQAMRSAWTDAQRAGFKIRADASKAGGLAWRAQG